jgi:hypothetical protein
VREIEEEYRCCCVLVHKDNYENQCNDLTSGPDDPFCPSCTARHPDVPPGVGVIARLRRKD